MSTKNGKRERHRFTADEKVKILEEARQPGTTVAEVLRRHQLDGTTFYRWEKDAKAAIRDALGGKPRARDDAKDRTIARLQAEVDKKSRIIAEVVEENLALKKGL
jgi:transposase